MARILASDVFPDVNEKRTLGDPTPTEIAYPMLDHALAAARRGIRVCPFFPGLGKPLEGWPRLATTNEDTIRHWWERWPDANPIGVFDLVLDFDVKKGKQGAASRDLLEALDLLPATYTQRSPTGGWHYFYRSTIEVPNSVEKIAPGVDVRGTSGFVLLAGAKRSDGTYSVEHDLPFADAPPDLVRMCGARRKRDARAGDGIFADHPADVARAVEVLEAAEPAAEGDGGDAATYRLACQIRDLGLTEESCLALMLEHWNDRCAPPWLPDDLAQKVGNAYRYAGSPAGTRAVASDFGAPEADPEGGDASPPRRFPLETIGDLRKLPPLRWIVPGWVPENAIGIVFGKWGAGKSFLLYDLMLHLAYGLPMWHGVKLPGKPMNVLLVAREGHQGFVRRIDAFRKHHGLQEEPERLRFLRAPLSLLNDVDFRTLRSEIRDCGVRFGLVVFDTVARAMPGVDMNEQQHVTLFMERCQQIGEATGRGDGGGGATVIGVHHQNKGGTMLGSTFFEANSDFVFEVTRLGRDTGPLTAGEVRCTKMKDGEDQWKRAVRYEKVALDVADFEAGDTPSSLVVAAVEEVREDEAEAAAPLEVIAEVLASRMPRGQHRLLDVQKAMSAAEKEAAGMTDDDVRRRHHTRRLAKFVDLKETSETPTSYGVLVIWRASETSPLLVRIKCGETKTGN